MPKIDPFSAQIVALVRAMPDDAILALVRNQLGAVGASVADPATKAPARKVRTKKVAKKATKKYTRKVAKKATKKVAKKYTKKVAKKVAKKRAPRATSAARVKSLVAVEKYIKSSKGASLADVAGATKLTKPQAAGAIRELKQAKKIFQGGDRRFARYASSKKAAEKASLAARKG